MLTNRFTRTRRVLSFVLALTIVLSTVVPISTLEVSASSGHPQYEEYGITYAVQSELTYTDLLLDINWSNIDRVGRQTPYSYSCSCFALAYSRTLLDNTVHYFYEYNECKRQSHPRFECLPAMCYNLCIVPESLGYSLGLSEIWRL